MQLRHPRQTIITATLGATLAGVLALSALTALSALASSPAHAQGVTFRYQRGYSVQRVNGHGWLCYGWPSGAYHCTQHWRRSGGRYVSLHPSWVPSEGSETPGAQIAAVHVLASRQTTYRNTYPYGVCTWGAQALQPHENLSGLGNAGQWYVNAQRRGLPTGTTPRVGATVVFAPGVQGASWLGHVGHVVKIGSGGSFLMEAMNDSAGWGRYAYRWVHVGWGVHFIY